MAINLTAPSVDIGIVVRDGDRSLAFYRDVLGFEHEASIPMALGGGGSMHRMRAHAGGTLFKLVALDTPPEPSAPGGGLVGATGIRYVTLHVSDVQAAFDHAVGAGAESVMGVTEARPGVTIAMIADPDDNIIEFVNYA